MHGADIELLRIRDLDNLSEVHHGRAVADVLDDGEAMRDEQARQTQFLLKFFQQVDHLRLDRHVERRHRLVTHQHHRLYRQCASDAHALALAAGKFVRVARGELGVEAHQLQQFAHPFMDGSLAVAQFVHPDRLGDDVANAHAWIERRIRILEHHLDLAAHLANVAGRHVLEVHAVKDDIAASHRKQLDDRATGGGLAATALADQPQCLAAVHIEGHPVDRLDGAGLALEEPFHDGDMHLEIPHGKQGRRSSHNVRTHVKAFMRPVRPAPLHWPARACAA